MVQSLDRGIKILSILGSRKSAGVTELAAEMGINKSTAFRLIDTLRLNALVEKDPVTEKYRISAGVLKYSESFLNNNNIVSLVHPFLKKLTETTKESTHLCVFVNERVIVIDQVKSSEAIKVSASVGSEEISYCTAVGKVLLAYLPGEVREQILSQMQFTPYTKNTILDIGMLEEELTRISKSGYAVDNEERTQGIRCFAGPIFDHSGRVQYSIGLSVPVMRDRIHANDAYIGELVAVATEISKKLGYKQT